MSDLTKQAGKAFAESLSDRSVDVIQDFGPYRHLKCYKAGAAFAWCVLFPLALILSVTWPAVLLMITAYCVYMAAK